VLSTNHELVPMVFGGAYSLTFIIANVT